MGEKRIINDGIILSSNVSNNNTEICLNSCFANYDKNIELMYDIVLFMQSKYVNIELAYGSNILSNTNITKSKFIEWVGNITCEKRKIFTEKYGQINESILPQYFYEYIGRGSLNKR